MTWAPVTGSLIIRPDRAPIDADERRMLDAVIAEPDDDAPRLVYADWLMARPEPELAARGELIVVQCSAEAAPDRDEHNRLKARDFKLVEQYGNVWGLHAGLGTVRNNWYPSVTEVDLRRGFIEGVVAPAEDYLGFAARLFSTEPVRELTLVGDAGRGFARSIYVRRLRSFGTRDANLEVLHELAGSPHVAGLACLEVTRCRDFGDGGASWLARTTAFPALRELALVSCEIRDAGAFAYADTAANLVRLVLDDNPLTAAGVRAILESPHLRGLRELSLRGIDVRPAMRAALAARFGAALRLD